MGLFWRNDRMKSQRLRNWLLLAILVGAGALVVPQPITPAQAPKPAKADDAIAKQVIPFVQKYCINCHGPKRQSAGVRLDNDPDVASMQKNRQLWEAVVRNIQSRDMPPAGRPKPSDQEIDEVLGKLNVALNTIDCTGKRDPGRVTIRRLNRTEYNNTIRDLVGVPFQPADDFPSDDVGYGFDNIGDVLAIPTVLLERYLAAANKIIDTALERPEVVKSSKQTFRPQNLQSTVPGARPKGGVKGPISLFSNGDAYLNFNFPADGEYEIRVRAYADQAGSEVAKMAIRIDDKQLKVHEVHAVAGKPETYVYRHREKAGTKKLAASFINDYFNEQEKDAKNRDRNLYIEYIEIEGPLNVKQPTVSPAYAKLIGTPPSNPAQEDAAARQIVEKFAFRAYRRPVSSSEVDRLMQLYKLGRKNGEPFDKAVALPLKAILVSPHFLYRVELDKEPNNPDAIHPISDWELASRLSYFLWSTMPDDELFRLAGQGKLRQPAVLEQQVRRMLKDEKASTLATNFAAQWLQLRLLKSAQPDRGIFQAFNEKLRQDMQRETELYFEAIVREDRNILELIDSDYTFVNERLAAHYGIPGVKGEEFRKVLLRGPLAEQRGGVLTHASVLLITSNPNRTSPVKRGVWILDNILGSPPPPPPPDVPELDNQPKAALTGSLRQRMEQHRKNPACASCHQRMDPIGFGFENYDAIGRWRTRDGNFPVDAGGELPSGQKFNGPRELRGILKSRSAEFTRCFTEKLMTYGLGRGLEHYDRCTVDSILKALEKDNYRFSRLVLEIVKSEAFQQRRGKRS
jgi:mono/diheme cytochrome c family protein